MRYWNFSFIVSELVQVNPDNLRAMSALTCNYSLAFVGYEMTTANSAKRASFAIYLANKEALAGIALW